MTKQEARQAERAESLLCCMNAAQKVIGQASPNRYPYICGALRAMLESMAGLFLFPSLFDPPVTEALRSLLDTIEQVINQQETPGA